MKFHAELRYLVVHLSTVHRRAELLESARSGGGAHSHLHELETDLEHCLEMVNRLRGQIRGCPQCAEKSAPVRRTRSISDRKAGRG